MAQAASLHPFFHPRSVAVVGVSRDTRSIGRRIFEAIRGSGFPGAVHAVTRSGADLDGVRTHASLRDLAGQVDLAVIAVPRDGVMAVIDDAIAAGVPAVVLITAGFAETDDTGRRLQAQLVARVRAAGVRLVGPNCMGVISADPAAPLNASFSPLFPPPGRLALSSQSGALGIVILELAARRRVGLSDFVSVGNKADVSSNDLIEYWADDPATGIIALYLESFGNPRKFARLARRIGRVKPIIAVKAGRTRAGSRAAGSHTAAMAASDAVVEAMFHQTGVIRAGTVDEMFDLALCLDAQPLPAGRRVGIVTNAGGPGILAADACEASGLVVETLGEQTRQRLAAVLPPMAAAANPLDMIATAQPAHYRAAVEIMMTAPEVDAVMVLYTPVDAESAPATLAAVRDGILAARPRARATPVVTCLMAGHLDSRLMAGEQRIPVYEFPENAARALGRIAAYAEWRRAPAGAPPELTGVDTADARRLCREVVAARGADWLTGEEARRLLRAAGLDTEPVVPASTPDAAVAAADAMGYPVVAKLAGSAGMHKSDVGGVAMNLEEAGEVRDAFETFRARAVEHGLDWQGVVIQRQIDGGVQTIVGVTHDRLFGPLVAFGLGGTEVELVGDLRFRVTPLLTQDIDDLIDSSLAARLLRGYRGRPRSDMDAIRDVVARVARLAETVPELLEMDLNPVLVMPAGQGCRLVDVRIRVGPESRAASGADDVTAGR
jgi:acetyl coenzyme A synthetase (ADP forming)-like protein